MRGGLRAGLLVCVHMGLAAWAVLFLVSLSVKDGGAAAGFLGTGNIAFLFVNIPLSVITLILVKKGRIGRRCMALSVVLAVTNMLIGAAAWMILVLFLLK